MIFQRVNVIVNPTIEPVTPEEFVDHSRANGLTVQRQPKLLERMLKAARQDCEGYTHRALLKQKLKAFYTLGAADTDACHCGCGSISGSDRACVLPRGNVLEIVSVSVNGAGVDSSSWKWEPGSNVVLLAGAADSAAIEWYGGYGDKPEDVPDCLCEGILQYATTLYEARPGEKQGRFGGQSQQKGLPRFVEDLWANERIDLW